MAPPTKRPLRRAPAVRREHAAAGAAPLRKPVSIAAVSTIGRGRHRRGVQRRREQRTIALDLEVSNAGPQPVRLLQIQLNKSPFGLAPADAPSLQFDPPLLPGTTRPKRVRLRAGDAKMLSQVPAMTAGAGVNVQIALKNADTGAVFYLAAPCPLDAVFAADATVDRSAFIARWKAIDDANESYATVADLPTGPSIDAAVAKLAARRCHPRRAARPCRPRSGRKWPTSRCSCWDRRRVPGGAHVQVGRRRVQVRVKTTARSLAPLGLWRSARCCGALVEMTVGGLVGGAAAPAA